VRDNDNPVPTKVDDQIGGYRMLRAHRAVTVC